MFPGEVCGVPIHVRKLSDFDAFIGNLGKRLLEQVIVSGPDVAWPFCALDAVEEYLYPPYAEKIGRTCTLASRFDTVAINEDSDLYIVGRQPLRPWGGRTLASESVIAAVTSRTRGVASHVTATVSIIPTRLAGQDSLRIAPVKTVSALTNSDIVTYQSLVDRTSIPY